MIDGRPKVELFWLPLGAGGHVVRLNGLAYEWVTARLQRRRPEPLFHSALKVTLPPHVYVIEMTPAWGVPDADRGVTTEGSVGARVLGRSVIFRYEIRCWQGGSIPDEGEAVESPVLLSSAAEACDQVLAAVRDVPNPVWGRDELGAGEMWNSNSVTAWILLRSGIDVAALDPPWGGRAPGWDAGVAVARRSG